MLDVVGRSVADVPQLFVFRECNMLAWFQREVLGRKRSSRSKGQRRVGSKEKLRMAFVVQEQTIMAESI